jgi:hypothetical protein
LHRLGSSFVIPVLFFALIVLGAPAFGSAVYSGVQDLVLQGTPSSDVLLDIELAGVAASWDTIQFEIDAVSNSSTGANDVVAAAGVALASTTDFPFVAELNLGDPFPSSPVYGSGGKLLWESGVSGGFTNGSGYAAMLFSTQGGGPAYSGWIHLQVANAGTATASLTVIDWAYSDVPGQTLAMGQAPEPSALVLVALGLLGLLICMRRDRTPSLVACAVRFNRSGIEYRSDLAACHSVERPPASE